MQAWNDFIEWLYSDAGWRVVSTVIVPFVAIIVATLIAVGISRASVTRILANEDRDDRASAVAVFVEVARQATQWANLPAANQDHLDSLASAASIRLRLLPSHGAAAAAEWAEHQVREIKSNSASYSAQSELDYTELRDRLVEWQHKPKAARRLFAADLEQFKNAVTTNVDEDLVEKQQQWAAEQAAAEKEAAERAAEAAAEQAEAERIADERAAAERALAERAAAEHEAAQRALAERAAREASATTPTAAYATPLVEPPAAERASEPLVEPAAEPVAEPLVEPVAETVVEPVAEPLVEPVAETVVEPVTETEAETSAESEPAPAPFGLGAAQNPETPTFEPSTGATPVQESYATGTIPVQDSYATGATPVQDSYTTGTIPVQDSYATGTIPVKEAYTTGAIPVQHDSDEHADVIEATIDEEHDAPPLVRPRLRDN